MADVVRATADVFGRAIIMPNLRPPVITTAAAAAYRDRILGALPKGSRFEPLMTLYLTDNTAPAEIARAKASGVVHAVGTTRRTTILTRARPPISPICACGHGVMACASLHGERGPLTSIFSIAIPRRALAQVERPRLQAQGRARARDDLRRRGFRGRGVGGVAATVMPQHLLPVTFRFRRVRASVLRRS
jgi:hypothetical protein